jgi:hypothetical protein
LILGSELDDLLTEAGDLGFSGGNHHSPRELGVENGFGQQLEGSRIETI